MVTVATGVGALVATAILLVACGGGSGTGASGVASESTAATIAAPATLTPASVMRCIVDNGGEPWPLSPNEPKGSPAKPQTTFAIGPERGHIGVYFSLQPAVARRMAKGFDEFGEYAATPVHGGRLLVITDPGIGKPDSDVIFGCVGA